MFLRSLIFCFLSLIINCAHADVPVPPNGEVTKIIGKVLFENKELKIGDVIKQKGMLETKDKSYIQIKIDKWKNFISVGANSKMLLNFADEKKYTLDEGICRWKSFAKSDVKGKIHTKYAALGVRGTDFLLKYNSLLNETEVIMFEGEVNFENLNDLTNTALLKTGQWGGIGGRFGEKIAPVLNLPKEILDDAIKTLE